MVDNFVYKYLNKKIETNRKKENGRRGTHEYNAGTQSPPPPSIYL